VESCFFFLEVPIHTVCKMHIKKCADMDVVYRYRDFFLCRKDVANIYNHLMKRNYQLKKKDEKSVNLWYEKHKHYYIWADYSMKFFHASISFIMFLNRAGFLSILPQNFIAISMKILF
jgi:hypothetical protein